MIVVADASPLINLVRVGKLNLIQNVTIQFLVGGVIFPWTHGND